MPKTEKKKARVFKPKLKPVPQPRKARARSIPNSLFARTLDIPEDQAVEMLRDMYRIRHVETALLELLRAKRVPNLKLSSGLEASAVGACSVLKPTDTVLRAARGHGHCVARGLSVKKLLAEVCGKSGGICGGRAGSFHAMDAEAGIFSSGAGEAAQLPNAVGAALTAKLEGKKRVVLCFANGEAFTHGVFHETLGLAAQWDLPLVIVYEYVGPSSRAKKGFRAQHVWERAQSVGMEGVSCDGLRVLDVREAVTAALEHARAGNGPTLIEAAVQYHPAQTCLEPAEADLEHWKTVDPISQYRIVLAETETLNPQNADALEREVIEEVKAAVKAATDSAGE